MNQTTKVPDPPVVLVIDSDETALMILENKLQNQDYRVLTAMDGKSACKIIRDKHKVIDAVLLDRIIQDMDGIEIVKWLNQQPVLTKPPIIMQSGSDKPEQIIEGINAGVFYYLTKPIREDILNSVILSAIRKSKQYRTLNIELKRHKTGFKLMDRGAFHFHSLEEAENLACFIANCFPDPEKILPGIAELTINAVEHGLLNISYNDKTELVKNAKWREELNHRANLPDNKDKKAELLFAREGDKYSIKISDSGKGFAWGKYLNADPARGLDNHGRGILQANMIFSKLQYNKKGNQVIATLDSSAKATIKWE